MKEKAKHQYKMKKAVLFIIIAVLSFSCSLFRKYPDVPLTDSTAEMAENDGLSFEKAVVIFERKEVKGIRAENYWLKKNYPGYRLEGHRYTFYNNRPFDIITVTTRQGETLEFYFNIYAFYGDI